MNISMIAAMAKNRIIGKNNKMPWHLPADLKHFKAITLGKPVIMGRKTYESIGKALPGRKNIVISRDQEYILNDAVVVHSCESALKIASMESQDVMVIGGGEVYKTFLSQADTLYLTFIDVEMEGDTQFPDYEATANWQVRSAEKYKADDKNPFDYEFICLSRIAEI